MSRVAHSQSDLFTPAPRPEEAPPPPIDPVAELDAMLVRLRSLEVMPWGTISAAMQEEYRVLWLAKQAGPAGAELAAAVSNEFERLLATTD
jgi:hypothetical protein